MYIPPQSVPCGLLCLVAFHIRRGRYCLFSFSGFTRASGKRINVDKVPRFFCVHTKNNYLFNINMDNKKNLILWGISTLMLFCIAIYPNIFYALTQNAGITYILTSLIFAFPIVAIISVFPRKWIGCIATILLTIFSIIDLTMIDLYQDYLLPGGIISTIKTNLQEATEFYKTNLTEIFHWIPLVLFCVIACFAFHSVFTIKKKLIILAISLLLPICFIFGKLVFSYESKITLQYYIDHRVWNRTPYNVVFQSINAAKELNKRKLIEEAAHISFGAKRLLNVSQKEVYIFAIGESLRYDNLSLNGKYPRTTTPLLEQKSNLLLFHNYYSQACLTMYSVPQIVTRATPDNYDLNFKERSIIEPFRECGFKTFTIVSKTNLLSYETYLSNGVDSLIIVPNIVENGNILMGDKTMIHIVDSLVQQHDKLFIMMQFLGNHSFFTNYEKEYDIYKPNANSCTEEERVSSDSLLINAYDNSILYTDWILSSIIDVIDKPNIVSSFTFVSDHGEHISKEEAGHGGNCSPVREEYHVPFIFWWSDDYEALYSQKVSHAQSRTQSKINGDCIFYSLCDMADIQLDSLYNEPTWSVFSPLFEEHQRLILVPDGINTITVDQ